jgi:hypothetical protein
MRSIGVFHPLTHESLGYVIFGSEIAAYADGGVFLGSFEKLSLAVHAIRYRAMTLRAS